MIKNFSVHVRTYHTLAKIRPPFFARSLGWDWAFNRERRVFIRIYAHPRPEINLLYFHSMNISLTTTML